MRPVAGRLHIRALVDKQGHVTCRVGANHREYGQLSGKRARKGSGLFFGEKTKFVQPRSSHVKPTLNGSSSNFLGAWCQLQGRVHPASRPPMQPPPPVKNSGSGGAMDTSVVGTQNVLLSTTAERVEALASEVSQIQLVMTHMMSLMENSPAFRENPPQQQVPLQQPPAQAQQDDMSGCDVPPHHPTQQPVYQATLAAEFDHLSRLEPLKIKDLWFTGDSTQLLSFL
ncbi:hypothetical protein VP01_1019g9 [Puccinia sorghi]|uniref:Uncharacterized protein n=1 Tax=Puccinia sorghi TaxID=27349 RepID=A0A0L6VUU3_9BASI|nr:hypothetical protein VP01_1019g9 [Puccinia sorghi]